ncbi:hypothetical protein ACFOSC_29665 [Streptantibioticus rubrisoli]|uniref:hypothetical protein n=1 Tax=Streptantibioticus rubrisoli TaxID=1387313 RepID=UPI00361982A2
METAHKAAIARTALAACADQGYAVAGSLAMWLHEVDGARVPDDIDLFTNKLVNGEEVRGNVRAALEAAGYRTEQLVAWSTHPDAVGPQNAKLRVSHPEQGSVVIDMIRGPRYVPLTEQSGMPVRAVPELLYSKLQTLDNRVAAKDFIDLAALHARLGDRTDRYLANYVNGYGTKVRRLPPERFAEELRGRLGQIQQLPDEAFAAYGLTAEQTSRVRESVGGLANRLAPAQAQPQRGADQAIDASREPRQHDQVAAALSDQQLAVWREQTTQTLRQAEAMVRQAPDEHALAQARQFVGANQAQIQRIDGEISRRAQAASPGPHPEQAAHVAQAASPGPRPEQTAHIAQAANPGPRPEQTAHIAQAPIPPGTQAAPSNASGVSADAQWLSQYRAAVIGHAVGGRGDEAALGAMRRLTEQADAVAARAYPDPHSPPRVEHDAAQPLLRMLATAPPVGANGSLPPQLLTDEALAQRHARLARAYQAAGQAGLPQLWQQGQLTDAEVRRRQQLSPAQRAAEDGVRQSLQAARQTRTTMAGPGAARALGPRGVPQARGLSR